MQQHVLARGLVFEFLRPPTVRYPHCPQSSATVTGSGCFLLVSSARRDGSLDVSHESPTGRSARDVSAADTASFFEKCGIGVARGANQPSRWQMAAIVPISFCFRRGRHPKRSTLKIDRRFCESVESITCPRWRFCPSGR